MLKTRNKMNEVYPSIDVCDDCYKEYEREGRNTAAVRKRMRSAEGKSKDKCRLCGVKLADNIVESIMRNTRQEQNGPMTINCNYVIAIIALIIVFITSWWYLSNDKLDGNLDLNLELKNLKERYPKQDRLLWQNVFKMMNESEGSVHSFVLLYKGKADVTAECFAKDLAKIINKKHKGDSLVVYQNSTYAVDYGEELNHYLKLVREKKHLIVPKLQEMRGETARIFHTLCDIGPKSVIPSYIIFTLEDTSDKISSDLKMKNPLVRVASILRNEWSDLLGNELHPLISRIVRNVAEISEVNVSC